MPVSTSNPSMATLSRVENSCGVEESLNLDVSDPPLWNKLKPFYNSCEVSICLQKDTAMMASLLVCCRSGLILLSVTTAQTSVTPGKVLGGSQSTEHTLGPLKLDFNLLHCKIITKGLKMLEVFDIQGMQVQAECNSHVEYTV